MNDGAFFFKPHPRFFILTLLLVTFAMHICQYVIQLPVWRRLKRKAWRRACQEVARVWAWQKRSPAKLGAGGEDDGADIELLG